ncbi:alpha/beta fold hydrolase [Herbiconiux sp. 11R-BC]|uniref:alpha/beta fold hydrolase n=1 Tax=Herbiconiux sp. 11R-BC TaxID=3111637 RepID=UPI003C0C8D4D
MTSFVLLPGAGADSWSWHRVIPVLEAAGDHVVAVDLPWSDPAAGLERHVDEIERAVAESRNASGATDAIVLVALSMGAFPAAMACERLGAAMLVFVAAMIPRPGESAGEWFGATGAEAAMRAFAVTEGRDPDAPFDEDVVFFHDIPAEVMAAGAGHPAGQPSAAAFATVWEAEEWPAVPIRVVAGRNDRLFPLEFEQRLSRERLGIAPDIIDTGHLAALSRPDQLAPLLLRYAAELA